MAKYINENSAQTTRYDITERIWRGPDGKIYPDGEQPDGSQYVGGPGKSLTVAEAQRYGLIKGDKAEEEPEEEKAAEPAETKESRPQATKAKK